MEMTIKIFFLAINTFWYLRKHNFSNPKTTFHDPFVLLDLSLGPSLVVPWSVGPLVLWSPGPFLWWGIFQRMVIFVVLFRVAGFSVFVGFCGFFAGLCGVWRLFRLWLVASFAFPVSL